MGVSRDGSKRAYRHYSKSVKWCGAGTGEGITPSQTTHLAAPDRFCGSYQIEKDNQQEARKAFISHFMRAKAVRIQKVIDKYPSMNPRTDSHIDHAGAKIHTPDVSFAKDSPPSSKRPLEKGSLTRRTGQFHPFSTGPCRQVAPFVGLSFGLAPGSQARLPHPPPAARIHFHTEGVKIGHRCPRSLILSRAQGNFGGCGLAWRYRATLVTLGCGSRPPARRTGSAPVARDDSPAGCVLANDTNWHTETS